MKNKIQLFILLIGLILFLFLGFRFVLGAVDYQRTPSGYTITLPTEVKIFVDVNDVIEDICYEYPSALKWKVSIRDTEENLSETPEFSKTIKMIDWDFDLPVGDYSVVWAKCKDGVTWYDAHNLEGDYEQPENVIFEVVEPPPPPYEGDFITITTSSLASTTAYVGDLFNSISPLVLLAVGVPLGFYIINQIIKFASLRKVKIKK